MAHQRMGTRVSEHELSSLTALGEGFTTEFKCSLPANLGPELCGTSRSVPRHRLLFGMFQRHGHVEQIHTEAGTKSAPSLDLA